MEEERSLQIKNRDEFLKYLDSLSKINESAILTIKKDESTEYKIVTGEDYNLCKDIREAGFTIMLNTELRLGNSVNIVI